VPERTSWVAPCAHRGTRCGSSQRSSSNPTASHPRSFAEIILSFVRKTGSRSSRRFNSVPGHHIFNELDEILKAPSAAKKAFIVGGSPAPRRWMPELHLVESHRFASMRRVEELSLSSILRSKLLRFFVDCVPKKWPLRGSCIRRLRWHSGYGYAAKACRTN
jgi:hypothetical protein